MSSISSNKILNEQPAPRVTIDEIISMVAKFEYSIDSKAEDKKLDQKKATKTKNVEQIQKENLAALLLTVIKLKDAVVSRDESRLSKIKEIYELLKIKLGNELYLLNLNIVVKFLQGYKNPSDNQLNPSIQILFDFLLKDIDGDLKNLLSEDSYSLLVDLVNIDTEPNFLQIVKSVVSEKANDDDIDVSKKILSLIYIYFVLTSLSRADFYKELLIVERVLAEHFTESESKETNIYLLKLLPEALIDNSPEKKIRSFVHLYLSAHNHELKKELVYLNENLDYYRSFSNKLSDKVQQLNEQIDEKDKTIYQLIQERIEKDNSITNLLAELTETNNRLEYEVNKYEKQIQGLKNGLFSNIQRHTKIIMDDITIIASRLPQNEGNELRSWIDNLKEYFESLGQKN